ncbi:PREDICTED: glycoprotein integral membrane protein 1 isoform X2 [Nanorana parkeri]|uniref:glycoprotein integral membrane protein 1 isoform X2 n=1 Tax=Nanorana parkeri TaxID=125878 RepID=UPI000854319F|nr:PREDICTED: glycoprotein integral membrane protein 1 isoform X2 [Nanorana parkeri]
MVRSKVQCIGPAWSCLPVSFLVFVLLVCDSQSIADVAALQELIRVNVSTQHDNKTIIEQVAFNISYERGQMHLNGFPLSKGVSRISCKMYTMEYGSPDEQSSVVREALVSMRLLISHWPTNSSTGETKIIVQQQVVEIDGNQVYQNVTTEMELVVSTTMEVLQHMMSAVILNDTWLHSIPRTSDVLFTFPNIPQAGDSVPQETTREYNVRQNTTIDEDPFPGKLPETPLQAVIPSSSYKVMCQFADDLRDKLCLIWNGLYPVLLNLMEVFFVGVITAAFVLELLKLVYPSRENRGILQPSDIKDSALLVPLMLSHEEVTVKAREAGYI